MRIRQECSQKWYRPRSWRGKKFRKLEVLYPGSSNIVIGFAIGPIMFFKKGWGN